jgi:hypothetical protein
MMLPLIFCILRDNCINGTSLAYLNEQIHHRNDDVTSDLWANTFSVCVAETHGITNLFSFLKSSACDIQLRVLLKFEQCFIFCRGQRIQYGTAGCGKPVILVHGFGMEYIMICSMIGCLLLNFKGRWILYQYIVGLVPCKVCYGNEA